MLADPIRIYRRFGLGVFAGASAYSLILLRVHWR